MPVQKLERIMMRGQLLLVDLAKDRGPMPGTELAFAGEVACLTAGLLAWKTETIIHTLTEREMR